MSSFQRNIADSLGQTFGDNTDIYVAVDRLSQLSRTDTCLSHEQIKGSK